MIEVSGAEFVYSYRLYREMKADSLLRRTHSFCSNDQRTSATHTKPPAARSRANTRRVARSARSPNLNQNGRVWKECKYLESCSCGSFSSERATACSDQ